MSDSEVRGGLKYGIIFRIFKSIRIENSPKEENLPFEKRILLIRNLGNKNSNPFYFGLPQLNIAAIQVLLPSLLFFTNTKRRGKKRRKFMAL